MRFCILLFVLMLSMVSVTSARTINISSVAGDWVTFDKKTRKASSIISIRRRGRYFVGRIIKTYPVPSEKKLTHCHRCKGDRRNRPIIGLDIIRGMRCQHGQCEGGTILDPRDGKVYRATMQLIKRGQLLKVRGYIGISLFGKTVVWARLMPRSRRG